MIITPSHRNAGKSPTKSSRFGMCSILFFFSFLTYGSLNDFHICSADLIPCHQAVLPLGLTCFALERLQGRSGIPLTSDLHGPYERPRKTILSAGGWPYSLEHGKCCLSAHDSIHELLARGMFLSIGLLGSSFTGLSTEEFTISQSSF